MQSVDTRKLVLTLALVFRNHECLHKNVESYRMPLGELYYVRSLLGGLSQIGLCPRLIYPRPRSFGSERVNYCVPSRAYSRNRGRVVGGKTVRHAWYASLRSGAWWGGGQDRRPTDNNSLQLFFEEWTNENFCWTNVNKRWTNECHRVFF